MITMSQNEQLIQLMQDLIAASDMLTEANAIADSDDLSELKREYNEAYDAFQKYVYSLTE